MIRRVSVPVLLVCILVGGLVLAASVELGAQAESRSDVTGGDRAWNSGSPKDPDPSDHDSSDDTSSDDDGESSDSDSGHNDSSDDDSSDDDSDDDSTQCVCHAPPGNPDNAQTICVGVEALCSHLDHGDALGECVATCGGELDTPCADGQFCNLPDGVCGTGAEGECLDLPGVCSSDFDPVCGCDGRTYSNDCFADIAGVAVDHRGECDPQRSCGGKFGDSCEDGQYCSRPPGECAPHAEGVCADIPENCLTVYNPVCGCDEMTYGNACEAANAGMTIAFKGECSEAVACGGSAGDSCGDGEFCLRGDGECQEDAEGVCTEIPAVCPPIVDPVCGCDRTTYDNACVAHAAGMTIAFEGECDTDVICGGIDGPLCDDGQFCKRPNGECSQDAEGVCTEVPTDCAPASMPVCGCDDVTYDNSCQAEAAGATVSHDGECDVPRKGSLGTFR